MGVQTNSLPERPKSYSGDFVAPCPGRSLEVEAAAIDNDVSI